MFGSFSAPIHALATNGPVPAHNFEAINLINAIKSQV